MKGSLLKSRDHDAAWAVVAKSLLLMIAVSVLKTIGPTHRSVQILEKNKKKCNIAKRMSVALDS